MKKKTILMSLFMLGTVSFSFANESTNLENSNTTELQAEKTTPSNKHLVYWEIDIDCGNGVTGNACCYSTFDEAVDDVGNAVLAICGEDVYNEIFP